MTIIKTRFIVYTRNRLTIFPVNAIPTKITTRIAYSIIAYIHNYTSSNYRFNLVCQILICLRVYYTTLL